MENGSLFATLGSLVAAGVISSTLSSHKIETSTHEQVAAAIVAKHDTSAPRDAIEAIAIVQGVKEGEFTLELADDSNIKGKNIPLPLLLKALAADRTTSNAEKPAVVQ